MICEECKSEVLKSKVYEGITTCTDMYCQPYYDENGKYHHHDLNTSTTFYTCSNGHKWTKSQKPVWTCCENKEYE